MNYNLYDIETGLYYLQSRYYDPQTGRFISMDSIEYLDPESIHGLNLYAYCANNPVMCVDPSGRFALTLGAILAIGGILLFTPVGGVVAQAAVSVVSYIGMSVWALGDLAFNGGKGAWADMNRIKWNPFNSDESAVLKSSNVSFYKGVPVFIKESGRSGSFFAISLNKYQGADALRHERGHNWQAMMMGVGTFLFAVAIPSIFELGNWLPSSLSKDPYYNSPWETMADILGGVKGSKHSKDEIDMAWEYYVISSFVPLLAMLYWF